MISAGNISSYSVNIKSPTFTSAHVQFCFSFFTIILAAVPLVSLSDLCLERSSKPSRSIERPKTKTRGAIALNGFKGDNGRLYMIATNRKYILAYRLNYESKQTGKKLRAVYLIGNEKERLSTLRF